MNDGDFAARFDSWRELYALWRKWGFPQTAESAGFPATAAQKYLTRNPHLPRTQRLQGVPMNRCVNLYQNRSTDPPNTNGATKASYLKC